MSLSVRENGQSSPETRERRDPFSELDRLNRQLTGYLDNWRQLPELLSNDFTPRADVEETDEAYLVEIELPGVRREDIDIEVAGQRVLVRGERKEKERVGILRKRERTTGRFSFEVILPGTVADDEVEAQLDQGVLNVRLPKPQRDRSRRIQIR